MCTHKICFHAEIRVFMVNLEHGEMLFMVNLEHGEMLFMVNLEHGEIRVFMVNLEHGEISKIIFWTLLLSEAMIWV